MIHTPQSPVAIPTCPYADTRHLRFSSGGERTGDAAACDEYAAAVAAVHRAAGPGTRPQWRQSVPVALRHAVAHALLRWTLHHTSFAALVYDARQPLDVRLKNARLLRELVAKEIDHVWYGARDAAECAALLRGVPERIAASIYARV